MADPVQPSVSHPGGISTAESPILILSCYRTGSTLLRYIVDTHPDIYSPPEVLLGEVAYYLTRFSGGLAGATFDPDDAASVPDEVLSWVRGVVSEQMRAATARKGKRIWCEKTPSNLIPGNFGLLRRLFPEARYLCLHRHCLDVVQSLVKMMHPLRELHPFLVESQGHAVTAAINYWIARTTRLLQYEHRERSRFFRLRYEDLVANPPQVLEPMFRFLGVSWDEQLVRSVFERDHDRGLEDHYIGFTRSIHTGSLGAGRTVSLQGVPAKTLDGMRSVLKVLGYPELPSAASRPAAAEPRTAPVQDTRWFFETHLPARLRAEPGLSASLERDSYQFIVTGAGGGTWRLAPREGRVDPGRPAAATCSIEISATDVFAVATGQLHPFKATETGRLRLEGDFQLHDLEKLVRLLQLPSAEERPELAAARTA